MPAQAVREPVGDGGVGVGLRIPALSAPSPPTSRCAGPGRALRGHGECPATPAGSAPGPDAGDGESQQPRTQGILARSGMEDGAGHKASLESVTHPGQMTGVPGAG